MEFCNKAFAELSAAELYELLKARGRVFLLEQGIHYLDMDDVDYRSRHVFARGDDGLVIACLRLYDSGEEGVVQMGRVLTIQRGCGLGRALLMAGMAAARDAMQARRIVLDAQKQTIGFYEKAGFAVTSGEFLEEGIVHVRMEREV